MPTDPGKEFTARVISDPAFRQRLFENPDEVLRDSGFTGQELQAAKSFVDILKSAQSQSGENDTLQKLHHLHAVSA